MIDLGAWASEAYRVPVAEAPEPDAPRGGRARDGSARSRNAVLAR